MEEVRARVNLICSVGTGSLSVGRKEFDIELVFVQFRMILELIAFGSLIANKAEYSAAYANFATHWNAQRMLKDLEKVNPEFYPVALGPCKTKPDGVKHFPLCSEGFMTKEEFVVLYDKCGKILHARNPFNSGVPIISLHYSTKEWVSRIQKLLACHLIRLVNDDKWIIVIPDEGKIQACSASPIETVQAEA